MNIKQTQKQKRLLKISLGQVIPLALKIATSLLTLHHPPIGCNEVKWQVKVYDFEIERTAKSCHLPSKQVDSTLIYYQGKYYTAGLN